MQALLVTALALLGVLLGPALTLAQSPDREPPAVPPFATPGPLAMPPGLEGHAAADRTSMPRRRYPRPTYHIRPTPPETRASRDQWQAVAAIPLLTDPFGEQAKAPGVRLRMAHDGKHILLHAWVPQPDPVRRADLPPESGRFWMQDHLELRFLPDPEAPANQIQIIIASDGQTWDDQGWWEGDQPTDVEAWQSDEGWGVLVTVPMQRLGLEPPAPHEQPRRLMGLLAYTNWRQNHPDIAVATPAPMGFGQAERFMQWFVHPAPAAGSDPASAQPPAEAGPIHPPVVVESIAFDQPDLQPGSNTARVQLRNVTSRRSAGRLLITRRTDAAGHTQARPIALEPGLHTLELDVPLQRPAMTRLELRFATPARTWQLGAATMRAGVPAVDLAAHDLSRPYLLLDQPMLEELETKLQRPIFRTLLGVEGLDQQGEDAFVARHEKQLERLEAIDAPRFTAAQLDARAARRILGQLRKAREQTPRSSGIAWLASRLTDADWQAFGEADNPDDDQRAALAAALNRLLEQPDLYAAAPEAFADEQLSEGERRQLMTAPKMDELRRILHHRALVQETFRNHAVPRSEPRIPRDMKRLLQRWVVTRDPRLVELAHRYAVALERLTLPEREIHLHSGASAAALAIVYDTFHPYLTAAQREVWQSGLGRYLHTYRRSAERWSWTTTNLANTNALTNGGGGLLALALLGEHPDAQPSLRLARKYIWSFLDYSHGPDGANTEGAQYWHYGTENFVRFAFALERALGHDDGLLSDPAMVHMMNMVRLGMSNDGGLHGVNDTIPVAVGGHLGWFAAGRYDDELGLWYGDHALRHANQRREAGQKTPYAPEGLWAAIFRPDVPPRHDAPPLPQAIVLPSVQVATVRSDPTPQAAWVVGVKGARKHFTHHNQPDVGAFFAHLRGDRLLLDPGYFRDAPSDHCLPLIDGQGPRPGRWFEGRVHQCLVADDLRVLCVDSTRAYGQAARRVRRWFVLVGEEGLVMLDDLVAAADAPGQATAQFQAGGPTTSLTPGTLRIEGNHAVMDLRVFPPAGGDGDQPLQMTLHEHKPWPRWGYEFSEARHFPVTLDYRLRETRPLVAVALDATDHAADEPEGSPAADVRVEREGDDRITVRMPSGREIHFVRLTHGWTWNAPPLTPR